MRTILYIYSIALLVIIASSCKDNPPPTPPPAGITADQVAVTISKSAGEQWNAGDRFLAMPFNLASYKNKSILIIGKRIKNATEIIINPLGAIRTIQNDSLKTYVLAVPRDEVYQTVDCRNFDEFSTVHSSSKWIIEQYIINRQGPNTTKLQSWEDDQYAINYLIR